MKNNKSILLCLEKLDIGGVETYVYNQALALKRKGYNVIILSKKGILSEKLESQAIKCINFDFENKIYYDINKINELIDIIKKYNVKEVHINQLSGVNIIFPACIITDIPYIVYLHSAVSVIQENDLNPYNYFEKQFSTYKDNFNLLFKYAYKIVAITDFVKEYTIKRYQIYDKEKCIVIHNSINFEEYKNNNEIKEIRNIAIISRISSEKVNSIINGIKLYAALKEKSKSDITLNIIGNGEKIDVIKKYIQEHDIKNVVFKGAVSNIKTILEKNDIVIGVDRCILEAISMKRLPIISGYDNIKGILNSSIITQELEENFCGKNLREKNIEELVDELLNLDIKEINQIVEENYNAIRKKLDINNNVYIADVDEYKYNVNISDFMLNMVKINYKVGIENENNINIIQKNWQEHLEYKKWMEEKEDTLKKECKILEEQIENLNKTLEKEKQNGLKNLLKKIIR